VASIEASVNSFVSSVAGKYEATKAVGRTEDPTAGQPDRMASAAVQIGDTVIDRILALSQKGEVLQFVEEMTRERLRLLLDRSRIAQAESRMREQSKSLRDGGKQVPESLRQSFLTRYREIAAEIDGFWRALNGVHKAIASRELDNTGQLYSALSVENPVRFYHPVYSASTVALVAPVTPTLFLLLWFLSAARRYYSEFGRRLAHDGQLTAYRHRPLAEYRRPNPSKEWFGKSGCSRVKLCVRAQPNSVRQRG
jgi:hypothetical protein